MPRQQMAAALLAPLPVAALALVKLADLFLPRGDLDGVGLPQGERVDGAGRPASAGGAMAIAGAGGLTGDDKLDGAAEALSLESLCTIVHGNPRLKWKAATHGRRLSIGSGVGPSLAAGMSNASRWHDAACRHRPPRRETGRPRAGLQPHARRPLASTSPAKQYVDAVWLARCQPLIVPGAEPAGARRPARRRARRAADRLARRTSHPEPLQRERCSTNRCRSTRSATPGPCR